jgi:hypothetical protein
MRCLGITIHGNKIKIAIFSKVKNQLILEKLEECSAFPAELLKEKNLHVISGLPTEDLVRRDIFLKLNRKSAVLKALPFQLETIVPYPLDETIVHPAFFSRTQGTDVVVLATTRGALQQHLNDLKEKGIDPDQTSCVPMALARWSGFVFPDQTSVSFIHENTGMAREGDKIIFAQAFEDKQRLSAFLKTKFGHLPMIASEGPSLSGYSYEKLLEFAVPIGLALEGFESRPCQFRQGDFRSPKQVHKSQRLIFGSLIASLGLAALVCTIGGWVLHGRSQALQKKIEPYFSAPQLSLKEQIDAWQGKLLQEGQGFLLLPDVPSVQDVLAWLGNLQEPIEIVQFHYGLVQYPKAGEKEEPYSVKIDLEFKAASPAAAQKFQEALEKVPTLVDKKQKVAWTAHQDCYNISLLLRKT